MRKRLFISDTADYTTEKPPLAGIFSFCTPRLFKQGCFQSGSFFSIARGTREKGKRREN